MTNEMTKNTPTSEPTTKTMPSSDRTHLGLKTAFGQSMPTLRPVAVHLRP